MKENPEITIIIPVYNCELYIEECLESVAGQTFENFEALVVNDGSNDASEEIIMNFVNKDSRFKLLTKENGGQSSARNLGLRCAKGKYIAFLDADDYIKPDFFEKLYAQAEEKNLDMAISGIKVLNVKTCKEIYDDPYFSLLYFDDSFDDKVFNYKECLEFIFRICVVPWNKLYRRDFLKQEMKLKSHLIYILKYPKLFKTNK